MTAASKASPSVLGYDDYRAFLRDAFAFRRERDRRFSQRAFALRAGLAFKSHLKSVLDRKLNLSAKAVEQYILGLRLRGNEAEGFRLLVAANQGKGGLEAEAARGALRRFRFDAAVRHLPRSESLPTMRWANLLVASLLGVRGFRADPAWISRKLGGRITPAQARKALRFLQESGSIRLRGARVSVRAAEEIQFDTPPVPGVDPLLKRILREAARTPGRDFVGSLFLTEAQAKELHRRLEECFKGSLPTARQRRGKGRLHLVLCDILPISV